MEDRSKARLELGKYLIGVGFRSDAVPEPARKPPTAMLATGAQNPPVPQRFLDALAIFSRNRARISHYDDNYKDKDTDVDSNIENGEL